MGVFDTLLFRVFEQGNLETGGDRTTLWLRVIQNYGQQPFINQLLGGGYWHRVKLSGGFETHNEIIAIFADYGFVGLILFILAIISMLIQGGENSKIAVLTTIYYLLMIVSLSPFQYVNAGFFLVWIYSLKFTSSVNV